MNATTFALPVADDLVRTEHFCTSCSDYIYAGEPVISSQRGYEHADCARGRGKRVSGEPRVLPPNPDWRGWTDYDGWVREYRDPLHERLYDGERCPSCGGDHHAQAVS